MIREEDELLIRICRDFALKQETEIPYSEELNFVYLLQTATRHRIMPLLSNAFIVNGFKRPLHNEGLDLAYYEPLLLARARSEIFANEVAELSEAFKEAAVPMLPRKGAFYQKHYFSGSYLRTNNDVDAYVAKEDMPRAIEILARLGYQKGKYSWSENAIKPLPREYELKYLLYPTHFPPMVRLTGSLVVPCLKLDLATEMDWPRSKIHASCRVILANTLRKLAAQEAAPEHEGWFHFLDCCLHLFREAYFRNNEEGEYWRGVNLKKFTDVIAIVRSLTASDVARLSDVFQDPELASVVAWVGFHTEEVMEVAVNSILGICLSDNLPPSQWSNGGRLGEWSGSMKERLFSCDLQQVFGER